MRERYFLLLYRISRNGISLLSHSHRSVGHECGRWLTRLCASRARARGTRARRGRLCRATHRTSSRPIGVVNALLSYTVLQYSLSVRLCAAARHRGCARAARTCSDVPRGRVPRFFAQGIFVSRSHYLLLHRESTCNENRNATRIGMKYLCCCGFLIAHLER